MSQHYSNPERSLPDVETFYLSAQDFRAADADTWMSDAVAAADGDCSSLAGWYYWFCAPGCLPDSEPIGPFASEEAALADVEAWMGRFRADVEAWWSESDAREDK